MSQHGGRLMGSVNDAFVPASHQELALWTGSRQPGRLLIVLTAAFVAPVTGQAEGGTRAFRLVGAH